LVDAKEGREIILRKIAQWKMEKPIENRTSQEVPQMSGRARAAKPGKRDLRELARSLGLGTAKSTAKTAAKSGLKSSSEKR
jgi:hypothetical protein